MDVFGVEPAASGGKRRSATTIRDVAHAAGVAISTASKALNGQGQLRPETRRRVHDAAQRLGFRPNDLAQSLMRGRSCTVGLLTTDSFGRFSMPLMMGIEDALGPSQLSVFLCDARDSREREEVYIRTLLAKRVDGIIVTARRTDPRDRIALDHARVPVVYAYTHVLDEDAECVLPDDMQGGRLATEHLLLHQRRNLACITGPVRFMAVRERLDGMRQALAEAGLMLPDRRVLAGSWDERWGYEAAVWLLAEDPLVDGVVCGNDQMARGVLDALREHGARVPDDLAVVGFDNWNVITGATRPQLTSVDLNLSELGRYAGTRLLSMIAGEHAAGTVRLPCRLVVRASCGNDHAGMGDAEGGGDD